MPLSAVGSTRQASGGQVTARMAFFHQSARVAVFVERLVPVEDCVLHSPSCFLQCKVHAILDYRLDDDSVMAT